MTKDEADALVKNIMARRENCPSLPFSRAIRLAIRAAVAQERERAARYIEQQDRYGPIDIDAVAAAIRSGEE